MRIASRLRWLTLTYQYFPEGSCMATYVADIGDSSGARILLGVGHTARGEEEVQISIMLGKGCP